MTTNSSLYAVSMTTNNAYLKQIIIFRTVPSNGHFSWLCLESRLYQGEFKIYVFTSGSFSGGYKKCVPFLSLV